MNQNSFPHNLQLSQYPTVMRMFSPVVLVFSFFFSTSLSARPPETWQENWFEHNQLLTRHYYDDDVAIYLDPDTPKHINWLKTFVHDIWAYVKRVYGDFGDDPRLYGIFHVARYLGCHSTHYFDPLKSYRNVIDCGLKEPDAWTFSSKNEHIAVAWSVATILEGASHGVEGWPAWAVAAENFDHIVIYDLFAGTNRTLDAQRWHDELVITHVNVDGKEVYWFRDWFWKIYKKHGGSKVLNRFFELTAQHFLKTNTASMNRPRYQRHMNWGEFFHFWSAATGTNLKSLAGEVFGWKDKFEEEFNKARTDFPNLNKLYDSPDDKNKT